MLACLHISIHLGCSGGPGQKLSTGHDQKFKGIGRGIQSMDAHCPTTALGDNASLCFTLLSGCGSGLGQRAPEEAESSKVGALSSMYSRCEIHVEVCTALETHMAVKAKVAGEYRGRVQRGGSAPRSLPGGNFRRGGNFGTKKILTPVGRARGLLGP